VAEAANTSWEALTDSLLFGLLHPRAERAGAG
jgi:hypothetical protein